MRKFKKGISGLLAFVMLCSAFICNMAVTASAATNTIWIVGDSTGCHYKETQDPSHKYKRVGFGDMIVNYIADSGAYEVNNLALSGRSSKSFKLEDNYDKLNGMKEGDILIIAFGHNDEKSGTQDPSGTLHTTVATGDSSSTPGSFKESLKDYIDLAKEYKATPVLCSPIVRLPASGLNWSKKDLHDLGNGADYAKAVKELSEELSVGFVDLTDLTKTAYTELGAENAQYCHAWENETTIDHTHLNMYGADLVAYLLTNEIRTKVSGLSSVFKSAEKPVLNDEYKAKMLNPTYVAPTDDELTAGTIESDPNYPGSWTVKSAGWYASAFGDTGGTPNTDRFTIKEEPEGTVNIAAVNSSGKLTTTKTGMAMYFMPITAAGNFMISADATINSIGTSDSQGGFGAIITDKILINTKDNSFNTSYAAATPFDLATGAPTAGLALAGTAFTKGAPLPVLPAAGDKVKVTVIKIGDKYTTSYKTAYGTFVKTFDLTGYMEGTLYAGLFAARNADVTFTNISTTNEVIEKDDPIDYVEGTVSYTNNNPELGTVTITGSDVNMSGDSGSQSVAGSTELTIKATPTDAANRASIKVGERELTGDSYTWKVDGDISFTVDFVGTVAPTLVTGPEANLDMTDIEDAQTKVQPYNQHLTGTYYYTLTANTTFDTAKKRISLGKGDAEKSSIIFETGDLSGSNLSLKVHFASGNTEQERGTALGLVDVADKTTTVLGTATDYVYTVPYALESNTKYYITSTGSTIYIDKIEFENVNYITVTPSFTCAEAEPSDITEGTYKIDGYGDVTAIGESIQLPAGEYNVTVTDSKGTKYTGKITVSAEPETQTPAVALEKANVSNIDYWFDEQNSIEEGTYTQKGSYDFPGGTVTLYDDFEKSQSYTYNGHVSYQGIDPDGISKGKALDASGSTISAGKSVIPASGNAYSFTPNADGTVRFYGATGAGKSYSLLPVDDKGAIQEVITITNNASTPYVQTVKSGWTYYMFGNGSTGASAFLGFEYVVDKTVQISGKIDKGTSANPYPANITFTASKDEVKTTAVDGSDGSFGPIELKAGLEYTITTDSDKLMFETEQKIAPSENKTDLVLKMIDITELELKGTVTIQGQEAPDYSNVNITYTNTADESKVYTVNSSNIKNGEYTLSVAPGTYSVEVQDIEGYEVSSLSKDNFTVKYYADPKEENHNFNNVLYKKNATPVTSREITVDKNDKSYANNVYPSVTEAIAGIKAALKDGTMTPSKADDRWVISVKPGTYEEQIIVDIPYVTLKAADEAQKPTITWYYGVGYKYYSIKPNAADSVSYKRGYYDIEYAYDKHSQATADRWGTTVRVTGTDFYAENIIFEASFNRKYDEAKEKFDGVAPAMESEYGGSGNVVKLPVRTASNFADTAATERAAAMVLDNAQAEFYNCSFLSSQDTLYMGTGGVFYFNGCTVMGQTDYIFGDVSTGVFDDCTLSWAGYTGASKEGYITAARGNMLFRNCTISGSDKENMVSGATVKPGYLGRHWADTNSVNVIFADTKFKNTDGSEVTDIKATDTLLQSGDKWLKYYMNPSSLTKGSAELVKEFFCTTDADYNETPHTEAQAISDQACTKPDTTLALADVKGFTYLGSWEPEHYAFNPDPTAPKVYSFNLNNDSYVLSSTETKDIASNKNDANITLGGTTSYHSEQYGIMVSAGASVKFTVSDSAEPAADSVDIKADFKLTSNGATIQVNDLTDEKPVEADVTSILNGSNSAINFKAVPGHAYEIVFGALNADKYYTSFYTTGLNITVTPSTTKIDAYKSDEITYEFSYNDGTDNQNAELGSTVTDSNTGAVLEISNIVNHSIKYGGTAKNTSTASFTMASDAKKASVVISSSYQSNAGTVNILVNDSIVQENVDVSYARDPITVVLRDLKANDVVKVDYKGVVGSFYSKGITVVTDGELSTTVVEKNTYDFDLVSIIGERDIQGASEDINSSSSSTETEGTITVDATGSGAKVGYNSPTNGYQINNNTKFAFTLEGEGTLDNAIEFNATYVSAVGGNITINVYKSGDESSPIGTAEVSARGTVSIPFKGEAGDYVVAFTVPSNSSFYTNTIKVTSTGTLKLAAAPVEKNTYDFDLVSIIGERDIQGASEDINSSSSSTETEGTITVDATGSGAKVGYNSPTNGYQINNNTKFAFTLEGEGTLDNAIEFNATYVKTDGGNITINVYKSGDESSPIGTAEVSARGTVSIPFKGEAGDYVVAFTVPNNSSFYTNTIKITSTGTLKLAEEPVIPQDIIWDLSPSTNTVLSEGAMGTIQSSNIHNIGVASKNNEATLYINPNSSGKLADLSNSWLQISDATIKVPVYAEKDTITFNVYQGTAYSINGASIETGTYTVTAEDVAAGYVSVVFTNSSNNYIKEIKLSTTGDVPSPIFEFSEAVKATDNSAIYVIGKINDALTENASKVGINAALSEAGALAEDASVLNTGTVYSKVVDGELIDKSADAGYEIAAIKITDLGDAVNSIFVSTYSEIDGKNVYATIKEVNINELGN